MSDHSVVDYRALMTEALLELERMQAKLDALQRVEPEPIAIIGMGCRFPGGVNSPAAFWQMLRDGVDAITEVPADRWDIDAYYDPSPDAPGKMSSRYGGFLSEVDKFDAQFFGISPREAVSLDPQQRLLLEVSWEALENAGLSPERLFGTLTGVFIGISTFDYAVRLLNNEERIDPYAATGSGLSPAAGRLSYLLGLTGPSMAIETACSSSLVSVHLAVTSLRNQESDLALAGGVNLLLAPNLSINFSKARMLAPDGRCKTFDATANGYVRGEGCGIIVLKRLSDALGDGDNILALVRGSAVNQDGASGGLTVPSGPSQEAVIRRALENSGVSPSQVSYIEAHGTGTSLGDPIEVGALGEVHRQREHPLMIGSVKTNIGHLEAAAGIASIIKVVLALQHAEIPPHLHFSKPNPYINWNELPVAVPTQRTPWPSQNSPREPGGGRLAGVSSFGFSGTNAHVVLEEAKVQEPPKEGLTEVERPLHLLTLSAKTENALHELAARYEKYIERSASEWADICFTANTGRSHFNHRLSVVARTKREASEQLAAFEQALTAGEETIGVRKGRATTNHKIAFLFTGQGSQYVGMGRQLYETQPTFRRVLDRCAKIADAYLAKSLLWVLYPAPGESSPLGETAYTQPALFALEYALAKLWESWGITPDVVMGHSVGEYVAACVAGVLSLEDGLKLVAERGRLMQATERGEMVAVLADEARVASALESVHSVSIAAINTYPAKSGGPQSVVISGASAGIERVRAELEAEGIKTRRLAVSHAFHSPLMEPIVADFEAVARQVSFNRDPVPLLISNVTGELITDAVATPEYWCRHIRQPVRFAAGLETLLEMGVETFLEIGPKPTLLSIGRQSLPEPQQAGMLLLPTLRPGKDWQQLLSSLADLYVHGYEVDWHGFDKDYANARRRVVLPTYPWKRTRYWFEDERFSGSRPPQDAGPPIRSPHASMSTSTVIDLLNQENTEQLAHLLAQAGHFSEEQMKFLPDLLEVLVAQHQQDRKELCSNFVADWLYEVAWQLKPRQVPNDIRFLRGGRWLILADAHSRGSGGVGQALAELLQEWGQSSLLVYAGETYQSLGADVWSVNPNRRGDFERLFQEAVKEPLSGIIHLWSLHSEIDTSPDENLTLPALEEAQIKGCGSLLHLVQTLFDSSLGSDSPRLHPLGCIWLVTQGAMPVGPLTAVASSPLWGLGKVVALEHPEIWGGMLDFAPDAVDLKALLAEIADSEGEDQLAFRDGQRYVARLVRASPQKLADVPFRSDGRYLITGGLGALGLRIAQWMVDQGTCHLTLASRRGIRGQAAQEAVNQLEEAGCEVVVVKADVSNQEDVAKLLTKAGPIRGIVHAAGVVGQEAITEIDADSLESVLRPKVTGTWLLHQLTKEMNLDFFVMFSSIASVWGSKGQAHYAAANAFLDALAHYRRGLGLPALSINWGPWAGGGMASQDTQNWLEQRGVMALEQGPALEAFGYLLGTDSIQTTVAQVDWTLFKGVYEMFGGPLLGEISVPTQGQTPQKSEFSPEGGFALERLEKAVDRHAFLTTYIQEQVAKALGMRAAQLDTEEPLKYMGLDSLMAVELRSRIRSELGVEVPIVTFLEGSTVATLVTLLFEQLTESHLTSPAATQNVSQADPIDVSQRVDSEKAEQILLKLEQLADEEVDDLLISMLSEEEPYD